MTRFKFLLLLIILILSLLTTCTHKQPKYPHLNFRDDICLIPYKDYTFLTCDETEVFIDDKTTIIIPGGFDTDLASIPWWYWSFLSPNRVDLIAPSVLHDYLYACKDYVSKEEADEIFYSALLAEGVSEKIAHEMFAAASWFGKQHDNHKLCKSRG